MAGKRANRGGQNSGASDSQDEEVDWLTALRKKIWKAEDNTEVNKARLDIHCERINRLYRRLGITDSSTSSSEDAIQLIADSGNTNLDFNTLKISNAVMHN